MDSDQQILREVKAEAAREDGFYKKHKVRIKYSRDNPFEGSFDSVLSHDIDSSADYTQKFEITRIRFKQFHSLFHTILKNLEFKITEELTYDGNYYLEAFWNTKVKALLFGFIPFGNIFKKGKRIRLRAKASIHKQKIVLTIMSTSMMELFNLRELTFFTSGGLESVTDEEFSQKKLDTVSASILKKFKNIKKI